MSYEDAKSEVLRRVAKYKKPPTMAALRNRLMRYFGAAKSAPYDEKSKALWAVECAVGELVKEGRLRCTAKLFHLPVKLRDDPLPW